MIKYFILSFTILLIFSSKNYLSAQEWQWAISGQGDNFDYSLSTITDSNDNLYVTGYFQSSTIKLGEVTLNNQGGEDIFLLKLSSTGEVLWAKNFGGQGNERGICLARDSSGFLYIAGYFESNNIEFGNTTLNPKGGWDIFIAKFDESGNVIWIKTFGSENYEEPTSISCSKNSIALTGEFSGKSIEFGDRTLTNQGNEGLSDIFITKFTLDGQVLWAKGIGGNSFDRPHFCGFDQNENLYIACSFNSLSINIENDTIQGKGYSDVFIIKLGSDGELIWQKYGGGKDKDYLTSLTIDNQNDVILCGYTMSTDFNFMNTTFPNTGSYDAFIIKFSSDGETLWTQSLGGPSDEYITGISVDDDGYIYLGGSFASDSINFSPYKKLSNSTKNNTTDIFFAKLKPDGTPIWVTSGSGNNEDRCVGVSLDSYRNLYTVGYFQSKDLYLGAFDLYNMGYCNIFIAKIYKTLETTENNTPLDFQTYISNDDLIIKFFSETKPHSIALYDIFGRKIIHLSSEQKELIINLSNLSQGIYFLKVGNLISRVILPK